jgi:hypothetical protein
MDILNIHLDSHNAWRCLPVVAVVVGTGIIEERRRYEVHADIRYDAALALGTLTASAQSTGRGVFIVPGTAKLTITGYSPTVQVGTVR